MNVAMETSIEEDGGHSASTNDVVVKKDISCNASSKKLDNLTLNTNKAGMQGIDAARINEIIQKASEGSRFYHHKQQAQQKLDAKIEEMLQTAKTFSAQQIQSAADQMEHAAQQFEAARDLSRTIVHVDMDMFYAAVEMRDNPSLGDVPMAVGSSSMLSTSNYAARKFGVRAAMPGFIGLKLCPELVLVPPNFFKYKAVSAVVEEVFAVYDPNYVMMSLDEAYLDITQFMEANKEAYACSAESGCSLPEVVVSEMRSKIQEATKLTASAGIAPNTRLAKVCSDLNKPNGQYYLPPDLDTINNFVHILPIRKIGGIGNVMEQQLKGLDIRTCGDLQPKYGLLRLLFSETCISYFVRISLGVGETDLANMASGERKSISTETTFAGTTDRAQLLELLTSLCRDLHADMLRKHLQGKVVTVKMKTVDFALRTRGVGLGEATQDLAVMTSVSRKILLQEMQKCPQDRPLALRLLGVRMSTLSDVTEGGEKQVTISKLFAKCKDATVSKDEHKTDCGLHEISDSVSLENATENSVSNRNEKIDAKKQDTEKVTKLVSFICPVCEKMIATKFLKTFNSHIDECLEKNSLNSSNLASEYMPDTHKPDKNDKQTTTSSCSFFGRINSLASTASTLTDDRPSKQSMNSGNVSASRSSKRCAGGKADLERTSLQGSVDNEDTNDTKQSLQCPHAESVSSQSQHFKMATAETSDSPSLLCPVCNSARFPSTLALNRHLDDCLSLQEVAALQRASGSSSTQQQPLLLGDTLTKKRKSEDQTKNCKKHKTSQNYSITKYLR